MNTRSLVRELAEHDDRQLLDIGLVRGEDGSLRLATDPALPAGYAVAEQPFSSVMGTIRAILREVRAVPFHTSASGPVILTQDAA
jgi:hypothetical protein